MVAGIGGVQRQARQDGHAALTGEETIALGIAGVIHAAVAIDVEAGLHPCVGPEGEAMRVLDTRDREPVGQQPQCHLAPIIVHGRQQQDIGVECGCDPGDGGDLRILAPGQVLDQ